VHLLSQHVRVSPTPGQNTRAEAFIKRVGAHSQVSAVARGLRPGQNYTLQTDTAPRCGAGTIETVTTLASGAAHAHGKVATTRRDIRSLALKDAAGQVVGCGWVKRHRPKQG
jgi:hypothetical protein